MDCKKGLRFRRTFGSTGLAMLLHQQQRHHARPERAADSAAPPDQRSATPPLAFKTKIDLFSPGFSTVSK